MFALIALSIVATATCLSHRNSPAQAHRRHRGFPPQLFKPRCIHRDVHTGARPPCGAVRILRSEGQSLVDGVLGLRRAQAREQGVVLRSRFLGLLSQEDTKGAAARTSRPSR